MLRLAVSGGLSTCYKDNYLHTLSICSSTAIAASRCYGHVRLSVRSDNVSSLLSCLLEV